MTTRNLRESLRNHARMTTLPIIGIVFLLLCCCPVIATEVRRHVRQGSDRRVQKGAAIATKVSSNSNSNTPEYNEEEARDHVFYSKVAFCTEHAITSWSCGDMCDKAPIVSRDTIRYIPEGKYTKVQGYVAQIPIRGAHGGGVNSTYDTTRNITGNISSHSDNTSSNSTTANPKRCIVSFRGSLNLSNWVTDFAAVLRTWPLDNGNGTGTGAGATWCPGCKAHYGFTAAYNELREPVHRAISDLGCTELVLAGHSLGAAVAAVAAFDLRMVGHYVSATWAFGMPRIGNAAFVEQFAAAAAAQGVDPPLWRVVHYHDAVPRAPPVIPLLFPVVHGGLEVYYTDRASSSYLVCPQQIRQDGGAEAENTSEACMGGFPLYRCMNRDHIHYLNESFAFQDFPDDCKATG